MAAGTWIYEKSSRGGAASEAPLAPNVVTADMVPFYADADFHEVASATDPTGILYGFKGTISLPIADPLYPELRKVYVRLIDPAGAPHIVFIDFAPFPAASTAGVLPWRSGTYDRPPNTVVFQRAEFACENGDGKMTPGPFTISSSTDPSKLTVVGLDVTPDTGGPAPDAPAVSSTAVIEYDDDLGNPATDGEYYTLKGTITFPPGDLSHLRILHINAVGDGPDTVTLYPPWPTGTLDWRADLSDRPWGADGSIPKVDFLSENDDGKMSYGVPVTNIAITKIPPIAQVTGITASVNVAPDTSGNNTYNFQASWTKPVTRRFQYVQTWVYWDHVNGVPDIPGYEMSGDIDSLYTEFFPLMADRGVTLKFFSVDHQDRINFDDTQGNTRHLLVSATLGGSGQEYAPLVTGFTATVAYDGANNPDNIENWELRWTVTEPTSDPRYGGYALVLRSTVLGLPDTSIDPTPTQRGGGWWQVGAADCYDVYCVSYDTSLNFNSIVDGVTPKVHLCVSTQLNRAAPNVVAATCTVDYENEDGTVNSSGLFYYFKGTYTLPSPPVSLAHEQVISVVVTDPQGGEHWVNIDYSPFAPGPTAVTWRSPHYDRPPFQVTFPKVEFRCENEDSEVTASPFTVTNVTMLAGPPDPTAVGPSAPITAATSRIYYADLARKEVPGTDPTATFYGFEVTVTFPTDMTNVAEMWVYATNAAGWRNPNPIIAVNKSLFGVTFKSDPWMRPEADVQYVLLEFYTVNPLFVLSPVFLLHGGGGYGANGMLVTGMPADVGPAPAIPAATCAIFYSDAAGNVTPDGSGDFYGFQLTVTLPADRTHLAEVYAYATNHSGWRNPNPVIAVNSTFYNAGNPSVFRSDAWPRPEVNEQYTLMEVYGVNEVTELSPVLQIPGNSSNMLVIGKPLTLGDVPGDPADDTQIMYNDGGTITGDPSLLWDKAHSILKLSGPNAGIVIGTNQSFAALTIDNGGATARSFSATTYVNVGQSAGAPAPTLGELFNAANPGALYWDTSLQALQVWNGSAWVSVGGGTAGLPAGNDKQLQFNDGGALAGDTGLTWDKTYNVLTIDGGPNAGLSVGTNTSFNALRVEVGGAVARSFRAASYIQVGNSAGAPAVTGGDSFQPGALYWDTTAHALRVCNDSFQWVAVAGSSGTGAAGSDTQIQYNSSGSLAASPAFLWSEQYKTLVIGSNISFKTGGTTFWSLDAGSASIFGFHDQVTNVVRFLIDPNAVWIGSTSLDPNGNIGISGLYNANGTNAGLAVGTNQQFNSIRTSVGGFTGRSLTATTYVQLGNSSGAPQVTLNDVFHAGAIYWDTSAGALRVHNGTTFVPIGAAVGAAAGNDSQVQFNTGGSLNADSNFIWNNQYKTLAIGGSLVFNDASTPGSHFWACNAGSAFGIQDQTASGSPTRFLIDANAVWIGNSVSINQTGDVSVTGAYFTTNSGQSFSMRCNGGEWRLYDDTAGSKLRVTVATAAGKVGFLIVGDGTAGVGCSLDPAGWVGASQGYFVGTNKFCDPNRVVTLTQANFQNQIRDDSILLYSGYTIGIRGYTIYYKTAQLHRFASDLGNPGLNVFEIGKSDGTTWFYVDSNGSVHFGGGLNITGAIITTGDVHGANVFADTGSFVCGGTIVIDSTFHFVGPGGVNTTGAITTTGDIKCHQYIGNLGGVVIDNNQQFVGSGGITISSGNWIRTNGDLHGANVYADTGSFVCGGTIVISSARAFSPSSVNCSGAVWAGAEMRALRYDTSSGITGKSGSFTTADGKSITVSGGIVTAGTGFS